MKKLASILFTLLLLFNVVGYYGLFLGLQVKHSADMIEKLDAEEYNTMESIIIKIPLSIPYASDAKDFERVDGEFEHQGEFYCLVKQRLSQDTLFVVCIKDHKRKRISETESNLAKSLSEGTSGDHSGSRALPTFIKDYLTNDFSIDNESLGWECDQVGTTSIAVFNSAFYPSIFLPPDII